MTSRVSCRSPSCTRTILPSTALETGGICMPCVQRKAAEEYKKYVEENKKIINPYQGLSNPVDIIKVYHEPRPRDDLIEYLKYSQPIEQVYASLTNTQIQELIDYSLFLFHKDSSRLPDVIPCLVSFTDADISPILKPMIDENLFYPSYCFRKANDPIMDLLLARVKDSFDKEKEVSQELNAMLLALAWIEKDAVTNFFKRNSSLRTYTYEAGWEINEKGERRFLYHIECYPLVKNQATPSTHEMHTFLTNEKSNCQWCKNPLTSLFSLDKNDQNVSFLEFKTPYLRISTCLNCSCYVSPFFVHELPSQPIHEVKYTEELEDPTVDSILPLYCLSMLRQSRYPFHGVDYCAPTSFSQIGGHPTWVQWSYYPSCPECQKTMVFKGQVAAEDIEKYREGIYYAFYCSICNISATHYQQT